jgi:NADPH:quinone reductase-like Zn-dependent oxidoreductase
MKAAVSHVYGPPDVVRVTEVAEPETGPGDLLVRVHLSTVNRTDCGYRAGTPWFIRAFSGWPRPRASVWGTEYAGVVDRVGAGVTGFAPGDRVFGYAEGRFGAHAELVAVDAGSMVAHVPEGVDLASGAAATEGGHYALSFLRRSGLRPGQRALVHGATGAIGSAAVQLVADHGVRVTATAPTAHLDLVGGLGAEDVLDWQRGGLDGLGPTFDAVLDTVGTSTFGAARHWLVPGGVYLSSELGPYWQNPALALLTAPGRRRRVVFPAPLEGPEVIEYLAERLARGAFRPLLDPRRFPLEDIVEAYRYAASGTKLGSVLLEVGASGA